MVPRDTIFLPIFIKMCVSSILLNGIYDAHKQKYKNYNTSD